MDYRFKIGGTDKPFKVELFSGTTSICTQAIDYPNTCVFFKELGTGTTYNYTVTDGVNTVLSSGFTTPNYQASPPDLPYKVFSLIGEPVNAGSLVCKLNEYDDKCLEITPSLGVNDCVNLTLGVFLNSFLGSVNNEVTIYKSCNGGSMTYLDQYNTNGTYSKVIEMGYNDGICYDMSTAGVNLVGTNKGLACLRIDSVTKTSGNFNPTISQSASGLTTSILSILTTSTTSTTTAPTVIEFTDVSFSLSFGACQVAASFVATPPLQAGQSVEMCFTNCSIVCANENLSYKARAFGRLYDGSANVGLVDAEVPLAHQGGDNDGCFTSVVLNSGNIHDMRVYLSASVNDNDMNKDVYACSYHIFNRFDKQIGGTYTFGGGGNIGAGTLQVDRTGTASSGPGNEDLIPINDNDGPLIIDRPGLPEL